MTTTAVQDIRDIQLLLQPFYPSVKEDGDIGKITKAAIKSITDPVVSKEIQLVLQRRFPKLVVDGLIGMNTMAAVGYLDLEGDLQSHAELNNAGMIPKRSDPVMASSFADPADIASFNRCKQRGGTDIKCFAEGDNGIGKWGHNCADPMVPMVALPREVWRDAGKSGGDLLDVTFAGTTVRCILGDTMPALENITNGCGIDLNPGACRAFMVKPPVMLKNVTYSWV